MIDTNGYPQSAALSGIPPSFFLIGAISEFDNRFQTNGDNFIKEISWKQTFLLNCVPFFSEPPSIKDLAELLGSSHQNTKQLLTKLERGGYVQLLRDASDRRKQRILLTPKATALQEKYEKPSAAFMQKIFENIDAQELQTTIKVITQLHNSLKRIEEDMK